MPAFIIHYATTEFKQKTELHLKRHFCAPIFKIKGGFGTEKLLRNFSVPNPLRPKGAHGAPFFVAEKEGFEPSNRFAGYTISNRAPSTKLGDFSVYSVGHLRRLRFL